MNGRREKNRKWGLTVKGVGKIELLKKARAEIRLFQNLCHAISIVFNSKACISVTFLMDNITERDWAFLEFLYD